MYYLILVAYYILGIIFFIVSDIVFKNNKNSRIENTELLDELI